MDLNEALAQFDRVEANLSKAEAVWNKLRSLIPEGINFCGGSPEDREYRRLCLDFDHLLAGLPPIDGWSISARPIDLDDIAQWRLDAREVDEVSAMVSTERTIDEPGSQIDEYRSKYQIKRRQLVRQRLEELVGEVDAVLNSLGSGLDRRSELVSVRDGNWDVLGRLISEVDRLFGPIARSNTWTDLRRHLSFAMSCDLLDIKETDWPAIKAEIGRLTFDAAEPLPIAIVDLGQLTASRPQGAVSTALAWTVLDDESFERLVLAIISDARGYQNPDWLMRTRAPDRGRDLSAWRVHEDSLSGTRRERIIIQCKHWLTRSVADTDISEAVTKMAHWEPPTVDVLIVATSGRFTADAVHWAEQHNVSGKRPMIELWPEATLERHLAERPHLVAVFGLR